MRRIKVVVSVAVVLVLAVTTAALPTFAENGNSGTNDGFGSVASQQAQNKKDDGKGGLGQHARDPELNGPGPREGIGNVARKEGGSVGEHGCNAGEQMGLDCTERPGNRNPGGGG